MAENLKYNLKDELLAADDRLTGSLSLIGMTMLTKPEYNNSMRSVMNTSHLKQFVNLENPDIPGVFTNGENVVGKHSSGYKEAKHETTVFRKIEKFGDISNNVFVYKLFVYDEKKRRYDVWERKDCENLTEVFGFSYNNDVIDNLEEGDTIEKGSVVYKSTSYDEDMNYGYGKNVSMMYTTDPYTSEDACVVSESLVHEMESIEVNTISIGVNQNDFLLNMYGTADDYRPLPELGEYSNGRIAIKRTLFTNQLLTDFKDSSLNKDNDSDKSYYAEGQVVDITIYCNNPDIEDTPFNRQILDYLVSQDKYYKEIKEVCEFIIDSGEKYTRAIDYLYKRACVFLDDNKRWKDADSQFGNLLIEITVKNKIPLNIGQKLTGRYGNKSVIAKVKPDSEMPHYYDENGNKITVKILFNTLAIINRTTAFAIYELSITFICNRIRDHMKTLKSLKARERLLFDIINEFNERQAKEMKEVYDTLSKTEKEAYIEDVLSDRIYIHQAPMWETKPIFFRLLDIYKKYDMLKPYDVYVNKWGREIKCLNQSFVGEMYIMKLKQTSRKGFSARATGSVNGKGLPERNHKNKTHTDYKSEKPIRFGEFETLNFSICMNSEDIELFHLLYRTSVKARRELTEHLLCPEKEIFEISKSYTSRTAEIFNVILKSLGVRLQFVDEDEEIREYNNDKISMFEYEGQNYMCTEFQFLLIKRKAEVEKELLRKYGIIDADELEKLVMNELLNRNYVVGPSKEDYKLQPAFCIPNTVTE